MSVWTESLNININMILTLILITILNINNINMPLILNINSILLLNMLMTTSTIRRSVFSLRQPLSLPRSNHGTVHLPGQRSLILLFQIVNAIVTFHIVIVIVNETITNPTFSHCHRHLQQHHILTLVKNRMAGQALTVRTIMDNFNLEAAPAR